MDTFIESITSFKADSLNGYFLNRCITVIPEAKRIVGELIGVSSPLASLLL